MANDTGYQRPKHFYFSGTTGVDVNTPVDQPKTPSRQARIINMMPADDGALVPRTGIVVEGTPIAGKTPVHSIRRLNDSANALWAKVYGTGDSLAVKLSTAPSSYSNIDSGYSGNPLVMSAWRPTEAVSPHMYVFDSARNRKVSVTGVDKQIGLPPPADPPTAVLGPLIYNKLGDFFVSTGSWTNTEAAADGTASIAGGVSLVVGERVNTTITAIKYDTGSSGWACVYPASLANIGPYTQLRADAGLSGDFLVVEVHRESSATTINNTPGITYDSGSTGLCTIYPTDSLREITQNALVKLGTGGGAEYVRVLSVTYGQGTTFCFRCVTVSTRAAGDALQVIGSFRGYTLGGATAGSTLDQNAIQSTMSATGGTGTLTRTGFSGDITSLASGSAIDDEDYFHISIYAGDLTKISTVTVMFDVGSGDFKENYYYRTIEQSVLVAAGRGTQTMTDAQRRLLQRKEIFDQNRADARDPSTGFYHSGDNITGRSQLTDETNVGTRSGFGSRRIITPDPEIGSPSPTTPANETGTGDNQWSEIRFRRGECFRYGTDLTKGWTAVNKVRFEIKCTASAAGVIIRLGSLNISGGGAPDVGTADGLPYRYRYRGRDSVTGVVSDYSPATAELIIAYRNKVALTFTQHPSPECDKLDIERFGGTQDSWLYIGSTANSATPTYTDDISETAARANVERSDRRIAQPWVRYSSPVSGTATSVIGNVVIDNGSNPLPANLIPGTAITVNGVTTTFRRFMNTARTKWEVDDCIGGLSSISWECVRPAVYGQPLRSAWLSDSGVMFACDGTYLRWSEGNDPDATHGRNYLEVTNPSDPLIAGFSYNGRDGVFTTQQLLDIEGDPVNGYRTRAVPNGKGLISPWALAVQKGSRIAWVAMDGIYTSEGSSPEDITTADLRPLFPNDELPGADTGGIEAPVITLAEAPYIRLAWGTDGSLYFFYRDSATNRRCLRYDSRTQSWLPYEYAKPLGMVYAEEGEGVRSLIAGAADSPDGKVYTVGGPTSPVTDDGTGFAWLVRSYSQDFGDAVSRKRFGDLRADVNPNGATVAATIGLDNHGTTVALGNITGAVRAISTFDLSSGNGTRARNISLELSGTTSAGTRPHIYGWEPSVKPQPEDTLLRATQYHDADFNGDKYMQGIYIWSDTGGVDKTVRVEYDGGQLGATLVINSNGERLEPYDFPVPFIARLVRLATADTDSWTLYGWDWRFNRESPNVKTWETQYSSLDIDGWKHMFQIQLALACSANVTIETYIDGGTLLATHVIVSTANLKTVTSPLIMPARKFKLVKFRLTCPSNFRVYARDLIVQAKGWNDGGYRTVKPFGEIDRDEGARI